MKIIVIGAGQGGMQAAASLAESGNEVVIFELSPRESHGHDQLDVVSASLFEDMNIPEPPKTHLSPEATFVAPDTGIEYLFRVPEDKKSRNVERRSLASVMAEKCEKAGAEIRFGTPVDNLIFEKNAVAGVVVNNEKIYCDLVIDSSGVLSPFRASFHNRYGITEMPEPEEKFEVYHAYYEPADGVPKPDRYRFYLKYAGISGISWCGIENSGSGDEVSILIGKMGEMTDEELQRGLSQLRADNPVISDRLIRGGNRMVIPVRYPAPIMVAPGYASVGDAAFMTVPLLGNGIENSIRAGQMLADAIISDGSADVKTLWKYEYNYYKKTGALCCLVDFIKRGLMNADDEDINFALGSGILRDTELASILMGEFPEENINLLAEKIRDLVRARKIFGYLASYLNRGAEAMIKANAIPEEYDGMKIYQWKYELERIFRKQ